VDALDKEHFRNYEQYYGIVTGRIEKSIVDIDCDSLQVQNLARSFVEFDEFSIDPASNPGDISIPMVIADLKQMCVLDAGTAGNEHDLDDNEEGSTSDPPVVLPFSLNEADFHLTAPLRLLGTISVTELPTNDATLRVEDVQRQLLRPGKAIVCPGRGTSGPSRPVLLL